MVDVLVKSQNVAQRGEGATVFFNNDSVLFFGPSESPEGVAYLRLRRLTEFAICARIAVFAVLS